MITAALTLAACSDHNDVIKLQNNSKIIAFGDSLTYGHGALSDDDTYPSQLEK